MGMFVRADDQWFGKLFGVLVIIGGLFYLKAGMDWQEENEKEWVKPWMPKKRKKL